MAEIKKKVLAMLLHWNSQEEHKMKAFDLQRMALNGIAGSVFGEVALRRSTLCSGVSFLKVTGRRGVRQMSLLRSADRRHWGRRQATSRFILIAFRCYLFWWYSSPRRCSIAGHVFDGMVESWKICWEGKESVVIVEDGELAWEKLQRSSMTEFEFLWSFA